MTRSSAPRIPKMPSTGPTARRGFTDQTGVPGDKRIQQFVVFFSDGMPTALQRQVQVQRHDDY